MSISESIRELARRLEPTKSAQLELLADEVAKLEKRAVPEDWTPTSIHKVGPPGREWDYRANVFQTTRYEDRNKWFYVTAETGTRECTDPFDGMRKADAAIAAAEKAAEGKTA